MSLYPNNPNISLKNTRLDKNYELKGKDYDKNKSLSFVLKIKSDVRSFKCGGKLLKTWAPE